MSKKQKLVYALKTLKTQLRETADEMTVIVARTVKKSLDKISETAVDKNINPGIKLLKIAKQLLKPAIIALGGAAFAYSGLMLGYAAVASLGYYLAAPAGLGYVVFNVVAGGSMSYGLFKGAKHLFKGFTRSAQNKLVADKNLAADEKAPAAAISAGVTPAANLDAVKDIASVFNAGNTPDINLAQKKASVCIVLPQNKM